MFLIILLPFFLTPFIFPLLLPVCISMIANKYIALRFKKEVNHSITCFETDQNSSVNTTDLSFIKPKSYQIKIIQQPNCNFASVFCAIIAYPIGIVAALLIVPFLMVGLVIFLLIYLCRKTPTIVNKME